VIPRKVQFIDGSAFCGANLSSLLIESWNNIFICEHEFLIDQVHHTLIRNFSISSHVEIGCDIESLDFSYFESCESRSSISFA
jgi:hypothetical protein